MIALELLERYGAKEVRIARGETLFQVGDMARFYFQIVTGEIKMNNYNDEGREFVQGIFSAGRSFGEPPLFADFEYPANAVAIVDCVLMCLPRKEFKSLLLENPEVHLELTSILATRLHYKATMAANASIEEAHLRILTLLDYLKDSVYKVPGKHTWEVNLTRQQIADLCGLRVETVIRILKQLSAQGAVAIVNREVWR